jgi:hypothetical protein
MQIVRFGNRKPSRTANEQRMLQKVYNNVDHAEQVQVVNPIATSLTPQVGNPGFVAQFDIQCTPKFFTVLAGAYTNITPAALLAAQPTLATKFPAFLFGQMDMAGGFALLRQQFPVAVWAYGTPFIYGADSGAGTSFGVLTGTVTAFLSVGDLVIPFTATLGGVDYATFLIVNCVQSAYGSMVSALSSDLFRMNMIRYNVPSNAATDLAQYIQNVIILKQSIFGKFDQDKLSPNSFKVPEQQQDNIIDVPIKQDFNKQVALATYVNYNTSFTWNVFVSSVNRLQ